MVRTSRKNRPAKMRTSRKKGKDAPVSLVRAVAKKVLSDALEDKYNRAEIQAGGQPLLFNASITTYTECYNLLPSVVQGVDSFNRIGDKIRPKSLRVDMYIVANGTLTTSMLQRVRLFVLQDKSISNWTAISGTPIGTQLLDFGSFLGGYSGLPNCELIRVNKRRYKVIKDKNMTLLKGTGLTPNVGGLNGTQTFMATNQYHRFSFKIPTPAVLNYSNPGDSYPTNFAPFMCLGYTQPDGDAAPDSGVFKVACQFSSHLDYEDA